MDQQRNRPMQQYEQKSKRNLSVIRSVCSRTVSNGIKTVAETNAQMDSRQLSTGNIEYSADEPEKPNAKSYTYNHLSCIQLPDDLF